MLTVQRRVFTLGIVVALMAVVFVARGSGAPSALLQEAGTPDPAALIAQGDEIYNSVCVACHQPEGAGVEGFYPALAGNPFVTLEDPRPAIQTVLQGRGGMPAFRTLYSDEEIAAVLTYVRQAWGNTAGPVSPEEVAAVRAAIAATPAPITQVTPEAGGEATPEADAAGTPPGDPSG